MNRKDENKCMCGFPLPPKPRFIKESLIYFREVKSEYIYKCPECKKDNILL